MEDRKQAGLGPLQGLSQDMEVEKGERGPWGECGREGRMDGLRQEVEEGEKAQTQPLELHVEGEGRVEGGTEADG